MNWGATDLSVEFGGRPALSAVTLQVEPRTVTAVVGGDGAGKTTLLRVLAGLPIAHTGSVHVPGPRRIGYVPASGGVFADLTAAENIEFAGAAQRVSTPLRVAGPLLARTGLTEFTGRLAGNLSGGMRRKLAVVMVMLHQPDLLILDEPTTGVDPVSRADLWRLIAAAASGGAAVVVSSAYLDEAERASQVMVLDEGAVLVSGTPDDVRASMPGAVVDVDEPDDPAHAWRLGRRWRQWLPGGSRDAITPGLEDVVIVGELARSEAGR